MHLFWPKIQALCLPTQRRQRSTYTGLFDHIFERRRLQNGYFRSNLNIDFSTIMYFLMHSIDVKLNNVQAYCNEINTDQLLKKIAGILVRIFTVCLKVKPHFVSHRCIAKHEIPHFKIHEETQSHHFVQLQQFKIILSLLPIG